MPTSRPSAAPGCGCPESVSQGISRRALLGGALFGSLALAAGDAVTQVAFADAGYTGDTLVVLSLRGGFDGLSAVAPIGDPAYRTLRPSIAVPSSSALAVGGVFGLHPALAPLMPLWRAGRLGAVQAVGMQAANRSHFSAMEEMERAAPGTSLRTGWLDRMVGGTGSGSVFSAVQLGSSTLSPGLRGPNPELGLRRLGDLSLKGSIKGEEGRWASALSAMHVGAPDAVAAPARTALSAVTRVGQLASAPVVAGYPDSDLGTSLRELALLIRSDVGVRVAAVDVGDWDMHVGLGAAGQGWMRDKLDDLARSLAAFAADLGPALDRTTLLTLSEFGRTLDENGSGGTDHGYGNAVLVLGGGVVGGKVHGRWPGLAPEARVGGDLAVTTDYRSLLTEALVKRCGLSASAVFPGQVGSTSGVFRFR